MTSHAEHAENRGRNPRAMLLLLAGLLTFGAAGLPWAVPGDGGGEPVQADADIWEIPFTLPGDAVDGEPAANGADVTGAGTLPDLHIHAAPRKLSIRGSVVSAAANGETPELARRK